MPIRLCADPTCANPATWRGRCAQHASRRQQQTNQDRSTQRRVYNSKRWRITRLAYLASHPICQACNRELATDVHHRTDLERGGDAWHPDNLEALCHPCHSRHTRAIQAGAA